MVIHKDAELEVAVEHLQSVMDADNNNHTAYGFSWKSNPRVQQDAGIVVRAYLADRQQRERDQQPPTREIFERLFATKSNTVGTLEWFADHPHPYFVSCDRSGVISIDTIAKLRAACLLLGVETEGII